MAKLLHSDQNNHIGKIAVIKFQTEALPDIAAAHAHYTGDAARQIYAKGRLDCATEIASAIQTETARRTAEVTRPLGEEESGGLLKFDDDFLADLYLGKLPVDKRNEIARHYLGETPSAEISYLKEELNRVTTQLRLERSLTSHSNTALRDLSVLLHEQEEWPEAEGYIRKASHDLVFAEQRNRALSDALDSLLTITRTRYSQAISIPRVEWDNVIDKKIKPALEMKPKIGAEQPLPEWGNFRDPAKPDKWCVRLKGSTGPGCEFHVATEDEGNELVAALTAHSLCA